MNYISKLILLSLIWTGFIFSSGALIYVFPLLVILCIIFGLVCTFWIGHKNWKVSLTTLIIPVWGAVTLH
ncbi:hypothetical protein LCGC14_1810050, partial [marine sediment metagenome]